MKYLYLLTFFLFCYGIGCAYTVADTPCINTNDKNDLRCFDSTLIKVYADESFTEQEKIALTGAFSEWSIKTEGKVRFDVLFIPTDQLKYDTSISHTFNVFRRAPKNIQFIGYTLWNQSEISATIEIQPGMSTGAFTAVALHEIGHGLWLEHYYGSYKSIMIPATSAGDDIGCIDLTDFCANWNCEVKCIPTLTE